MRLERNRPVSGERILVVDDSLQMREFLSKTVLEAESYVVAIARNGQEGLESAVANKPALIITDLAMPEMDGLQMLEALRARGLSMPAILMTAEGSEDIAVRALRAGVMDYFVKPFDVTEMGEAVKRVLSATRIGALRTSVPDQRRLQVLNTLIAVGKSVTSLLDLEQVLRRVVEAAVFLTSSEEGTLMLLDPVSHDLYMRATKNVQEGLLEMRLKVNDSLAGHVVKTGEPLLLSGEGLQKIKTAYLVYSLIYVPLKIGGKVLGVLGVHNRSANRAFDQEALASVTALADYAAIAIDNAHLYIDADSERKKLNRILNHIQDAVLMVDPDGRVALCNPLALEFMKVGDLKAVLGQPLAAVTDNRSLLDLLEWSRSDNRTQYGEVHRDSRIHNAHLSVIEGLGCVVVMQDITHLKELDRIKSELVMMVSHDLRSPLTAILSYVELMGRMGDLNEQQREYATQVKQNVKSITGLINDLLEMGKIEAGLDREREPVQVAELARESVEALRSRAQQKHLSLVYDATESLPPVLGNPVRLRQVFANLVDNAIKYTPGEGEVRVHLFVEEDQVVANISDTGMGIPLEDQPHIFEKFYRVKGIEATHEGTGLGLSIVHSIVEAHGGRIWVNSMPGVGTTFTVMLPVYDRATSPTAPVI
jgi:two-component system NtrC family sensor kinase